MAKHKFSRIALQTIAEIVNGQHAAPEVEVGPATGRYAVQAINFDDFENEYGERCVAIFLRYKKQDGDNA